MYCDGGRERRGEHLSVRGGHLKVWRGGSGWECSGSNSGWGGWEREGGRQQRNEYASLKYFRKTGFVFHYKYVFLHSINNMKWILTSVCLQFKQGGQTTLYAVN